MKIITCILNSDQVGYKHALQASCNYHKLELITILGKEWKTNRQKYLLLNEYLSELDKNELVFFTDGYDTIFLAGELEILEKYNNLAKQNQIIMSADRFCAPDNSKSNHFIKTKFGYDYLCSGGFIGTVANITYAIEHLIEIEKSDQSNENKEYYWSDQYLWTKLFLSKKVDIILDNNCEIFQTFTSCESIKNLYEFVNKEPQLSPQEDLYSRNSITNSINEILKEVSVENSGRVFNKRTKTFPIQIHFNTKINKLIMFIDPFVKLIEAIN